jgi:hypothetical protein
MITGRGADAEVIPTLGCAASAANGVNRAAPPAIHAQARSERFDNRWRRGAAACDEGDRSVIPEGSL